MPYRDNTYALQGHYLCPTGTIPMPCRDTTYALQGHYLCPIAKLDKKVLFIYFSLDKVNTYALKGLLNIDKVLYKVYGEG